MALVKCAECSHLVSNKALQCPNCGYAPRGNCKNCRNYESMCGFSSGECKAAKNEFVREYKSVCPAVIKIYQ